MKDVNNSAVPLAKPPVRPLTRAEMKELRKQGLDPAILEISSRTVAAQKTAELVDWILETVYPDLNFDALPYPQTVAIAMSVYKATYGTEEEEKN